MRKIFFFILFTGIVSAQSTPTLYVASQKGLSLREGPSTDSKRIKLLEYGTAITNYTYAEGDWITIDGYGGRWLKVTTNDAKTGYVFDGYTLPIKVPNGGSMMDYFISVFGKVVFEDSIIHRSDGDDNMIKHMYHFKDGVIFSDTYMYEAGEFTLENLQMDNEKGYLLYYLIEEKLGGGYRLLNNSNYPKGDYKSDTLNIQKDKMPWGNLFIEHFEEGPVYWLKIFWLAGGLVISWGSGI